ncbi:hypothetical protein KXX21_005129 [Aspergillus fumigatus]|nr:hypothetical protein KXX21_005129 [Aspergillus fumigatus]KMK56463.1 hypothetical protein Y699_05378 [Aspergillus fumigatus Z5]
MCGADICLGIRLRDSGRVFTFMADASGFWSKFDASLDKCYPVPIRKTCADFSFSSKKPNAEA